MYTTIYKIIYNPLVNSILRSLNKVARPMLPERIRIAPAGVFSIKGDQGGILKIKTNQTNYLTKCIYWNGYLNFEYTGIFIRLIRKVNVFYDVGANIGYYSLLAALENKDIRVVGFEPASGALHFFKENVRINRFSNITIESLALSELEGKIMFYEVRNKKYKYLKHNLSGESNAGSKTTGLNFVPHEVESSTLDQYVSKVGEVGIDLIKIDTEGTEHLILGKATSVLENMKPIIICETLYNTIEPQIEAILKGYGYFSYNHIGDGLKKVDSIARKEDDGVRNCFFVHPSRLHLIEEFIV